MAATRQRTENWRKCLWQIYERNGAIEISLPESQDAVDGDDTSVGAGATNLIWRVRILGIEDDAITVETPAALGKSLYLEDGVRLIAAIVIGQNRWMFETEITGHVKQRGRGGKAISALRLFLPKKVERCGRRNFYRISTTELTLPRVRLWSLIDPASAAVAEHANEEMVRRIQEKSGEAGVGDALDKSFIEQLALPEVGPPFDGVLANLGGGGLGVIVEQDNSLAFTSHRIYYLQFALPPEIAVPLAVTAKLVHTHMDSGHRIYAGLAFDFSRNKSHESFIAEQLERYVALRQDVESVRRAA